MSLSIYKSVIEGGTTHLVQLNICLEDSDWSPNFDRIDVERSRGLSTGPFEALTADEWSHAVLPKDAGSPALMVTGPKLDLVGKPLLLRVNEEFDYTVTFTDPGPGYLSVYDAALQIGTAVPLVDTWVDADAKVVISTKEAGTRAAVRVVGGDAAPHLGYGLYGQEAVAFGKDARMALVLGKERYTFQDLQGKDGYFYRMRFYSTGTQAFSGYTLPAPVPRYKGLLCTDTVVGRVTLVDLDGRPLSGVQVRVFNRKGLFEKSGLLVAGRQLQTITKEDGRAEFQLVRGMEVEVAVDGTSLVRQITVPEDPAEGVFNLLDPSIGPDDYFRVKQPHIEYAYKRTL